MISNTSKYLPAYAQLHFFFREAQGHLSLNSTNFRFWISTNSWENLVRISFGKVCKLDIIDYSILVRI